MSETISPGLAGIISVFQFIFCKSRLLWHVVFHLHRDVLRNRMSATASPGLAGIISVFHFIFCKSRLLWHVVFYLHRGILPNRMSATVGPGLAGIISVFHFIFCKSRLLWHVVFHLHRGVLLNRMSATVSPGSAGILLVFGQSQSSHPCGARREGAAAAARVQAPLAQQGRGERGQQPRPRHDDGPRRDDQPPRGGRGREPRVACKKGWSPRGPKGEGGTG